jgi:hypothetical protein
MKLAYAAFVAFMVPVMPAFAADPEPQTKTTTVAEKSTEERDPNRVICRTQTETGSLLARNGPR